MENCGKEQRSGLKNNRNALTQKYKIKLNKLDWQQITTREN